ncbi:hypothetical protein NL108_002572 [Boleophthalmus pectinirostris]|nr:hypothetical protein NL108_002572 [Boleophthalmus pectinirostris]
MIYIWIYVYSLLFYLIYAAKISKIVNTAFKELLFIKISFYISIFYRIFWAIRRTQKTSNLIKKRPGVPQSRALYMNPLRCPSTTSVNYKARTTCRTHKHTRSRQRPHNETHPETHSSLHADEERNRGTNRKKRVQCATSRHD